MKILSPIVFSFIGVSNAAWSPSYWQNTVWNQGLNRGPSNQNHAPVTASPPLLQQPYRVQQFWPVAEPETYSFPEPQAEGEPSPPPIVTARPSTTAATNPPTNPEGCCSPVCECIDEQPWSDCFNTDPCKSPLGHMYRRRTCYDISTNATNIEKRMKGENLCQEFQEEIMSCDMRNYADNEYNGVMWRAEGQSIDQYESVWSQCTLDPRVSQTDGTDRVPFDTADTSMHDFFYGNVRCGAGRQYCEKKHICAQVEDTWFPEELWYVAGPEEQCACQDCHMVEDTVVNVPSCDAKCFPEMFYTVTNYYNYCMKAFYSYDIQDKLDAQFETLTQGTAPTMPTYSALESVALFESTSEVIGPHRSVCRWDTMYEFWGRRFDIPRDMLDSCLKSDCTVEEFHYCYKYCDHQHDASSYEVHGPMHPAHTTCYSGAALPNDMGYVSNAVVADWMNNKCSSEWFYKSAPENCTPGQSPQYGEPLTESSSCDEQNDWVYFSNYNRNYKCPNTTPRYRQTSVVRRDRCNLHPEIRETQPEVMCNIPACPECDVYETWSSCMPITDSSDINFGNQCVGVQTCSHPCPTCENSMKYCKLDFAEENTSMCECGFRTERKQCVGELGARSVQVVDVIDNCNTVQDPWVQVGFGEHRNQDCRDAMTGELLDSSCCAVSQDVWVQVCDNQDRNAILGEVQNEFPFDIRSVSAFTGNFDANTLIGKKTDVKYSPPNADFTRTERCPSVDDFQKLAFFNVDHCGMRDTAALRARLVQEITNARFVQAEYGNRCGSMVKSAEYWTGEDALSRCQLPEKCMCQDNASRSLCFPIFSQFVNEWLEIANGKTAEEIPGPTEEEKSYFQRTYWWNNDGSENGNTYLHNFPVDHLKLTYGCGIGACIDHQVCTVGFRRNFNNVYEVVNQETIANENIWTEKKSSRVTPCVVGGVKVVPEQYVPATTAAPVTNQPEYAYRHKRNVAGGWVPNWFGNGPQQQVAQVAPQPEGSYNSFPDPKPESFLAPQPEYVYAPRPEGEPMPPPIRTRNKLICEYKPELNMKQLIVDNLVEANQRLANYKSWEGPGVEQSIVDRESKINQILSAFNRALTNQNDFEQLLTVREHNHFNVFTEDRFAADSVSPALSRDEIQQLLDERYAN